MLRAGDACKRRNIWSNSADISRNRTMHPRQSVALQMAACLLLVACGGGGAGPAAMPPPPPPPTSSVPSISIQPSDQNVSVGQSATFTVAATSTAALSYQWQKDAAAIAGATAASYTTGASAAADGGSSFAVVVSNSSGSVTANSATRHSRAM